MAAILLLGTIALLPLAPSANAQGTTTITTSTDIHGNKFFGPAWAEVLISVSSHASDTAQGQLPVTVNAFGASNTYQLLETGTTSGLFLLYIKVDNNAAEANEPLTPATPFSATTFTRLHIGPAGVGANYGATAGNNVNAELAVNAANIVEGASVQVSASGVTKTMTWDDSTATISIDRSAYGPGGNIITTFKDQDANLDPTAANVVTELAGNVILTNAGDSAGLAAATFTETGPNTAVFELTSLALTAGTLAVGQDSVSRSLVVNDYKAFNDPAGGGAVINPAVTSTNYGIAAGILATGTASYTVQSQRGIFNTLSGQSFASELPLMVTDLDRNTNSRTTQGQVGALRITTGGVTTLFDLTENGLNSNQLIPDYAGDDIDLTFGSATVAGQGILGVTQGNDITVEYLDVYYLRAAFNEAATNAVRVDWNGDGDFTDNPVATVVESSVRVDLNGDGDILDTVNGIIEANIRVDINGDGDFSDTVNGLALNENTALTIDITGNGAIGQTPAAGTAINESTVRFDLNLDNAITAAAVGGVTENQVSIDLDGIDLGGVSSKLTFQLTDTPAALTADRTTASKSSVVGLMLVDPDINDDSSAQESYTVNFAGGATTAYTAVNLPGALQSPFDLRIRFSGAERQLTSPFSVTFTENGTDSSTFMASVNLQQLTAAVGGGFAFIDGDSVQFAVRSQLDQNLAVRPETTASVTIGLTKPTLSVDRQTIGVPRNGGLAAVADSGLNVGPAFANLGNQLVSVTIVDAGANNNSLAEDTLIAGTGATAVPPAGLTLNNKLRITFLDSNGNAFAGNGNIQVSTAIKETGFDTGVFTGVIQVNFLPNDTPAQWIGSKMKLEYAGQDNTFGTNDDADTVSVGFTARNAILSTNTTIIANGQSITITVRDEDGNRDATIAEQVTVGLRWTDATGTIQNRAQALDETGVNTGIFSKSLTIGTSTVGGVVLQVQADTDFRLRYYDLTPSIPGSAAWPAATSTQTQIDLTLRTTSSTGGMVVSPEIVGPGTQILVTITDSDLNTNPAAKQTVAGRVTAVSDRGAASRADLNVDETGPNTGVFEGKVRLNPAQAAGAPTPGPANDVTINALPGDIVSIRYEDESGSAGQRTTVTRTINVVSVDPTMTFDKESYSIGDPIMLTINDPDANRDPDTADILTIRATSTTDAVGLTNVQAIETSNTSGIFVAQIQTSSTFSTGALQVGNGDIVTIEYEDAFPAAFRQKFDQNGTLAGSTQKFRVTTTMGLSASTETTTPSAPAFTDITGGQISEISAGGQVFINTNIKNNDPIARTVTALIEVRDADGFTVQNSLVTATIAAGGTSGIGSSWVPSASGDYQIRVFVLSSLDNPQILSEVVTQDVTVS
ncbi:hypothetical protein [Nitrososphaera sp.]|uniref:beta strand repeat-containing protein n=2 Tax=Nitrososphaera sp. TaxID=1971748 RepID=UPI0017CB4195|nr:hypothetical protein [Nitrososphaera sp.]NWG36298.1 hypothetical protein [Nitrososphaera sp.]